MNNRVFSHTTLNTRVLKVQSRSTIRSVDVIRDRIHMWDACDVFDKFKLIPVVWQCLLDTADVILEIDCSPHEFVKLKKKSVPIHRGKLKE